MVPMKLERAQAAVCLGWVMAVVVTSGCGSSHDATDGGAAPGDASVRSSDGGAGAGEDASTAGDAATASDAASGEGEDGAADAGVVSYLTSGSVTTVENLGAFPAARAANGLGWNLATGSAVEMQAALAAGAKHGRIQCAWQEVEGQTDAPSNTSKGFALPADCTQTLAMAKQGGMALTLLAGYGPPAHPILTVTVAADTPVGAAAVPVAFVSSMGGDSFGSLSYPYDYLYAADASGLQIMLSPRHSYPGTLITASGGGDATHTTLSLASALQVPLASGTTLTVEEILYPSVMSDAASDPSTAAFVRYVQFLGSQCASAGVTCDIELWNEPPWPDDCWDNRLDCYDSNPGYDEELDGPDWGMVAALQATTPPAGVTYTWAGTNKSGDSSVLSPNMPMYSGVPFAEPATAVTAEAFHPYTSDPEDDAWSQPCLVQQFASPSYMQLCNLVAGSPSNALKGEALTLSAQAMNPQYGVRHVITETGTSTQSSADEAHKARFALRQYLSFLAGGVEWVEFYRMYEAMKDGSTGYSAIVPNPDGSYTSLPLYTALRGLVADASSIGGAPLSTFAADGSDLTVVSYSGTYPLDVVQLVGSRSTDSASSELLFVYQRSFSTSTCDLGTCWAKLASPPTTSTTLALPAGLTVTRAVNVLTQAAVPFAASGGRVTVDVSDDPIELVLLP